MNVDSVTRKRSISIQYDVGATTTTTTTTTTTRNRNPLSEAEALLALAIKKKLRRLPHVFSRVLELPFRSDADVSVEELPHSFRFVVVDTPGGIAHVEARTLDVHPGVTVTKIVLLFNETESMTEFSLDELDLDVWRFRLPESTRPELAAAALVGGELIVTVPKEEADDEDEDVWRRENRGMDGTATLVLVQ